MGEVGQYTVTLRKLLNNITFPCYHFCQLIEHSQSPVEQKHLFSLPSKAVRLLSGTSLLSWLWLAELCSETLWSGAVAGDNYSPAQIWWLAHFLALRVHPPSIYDFNRCFFWFRPVETFWSLFITQTLQPSPVHASSFSHLLLRIKEENLNLVCILLVACQNFCFLCSALCSLNQRHNSSVNRVMKKCGLFLIVFVVAALAGVVWSGLPESLVALTEPGFRCTAPCTTHPRDIMKHHYKGTLNAGI